MPLPEGQWQLWQDRLRQTVQEKRYQHCLAVREEAAKLARHWNLDEEKAEVAGLLHDVARDLSFRQLYDRAKQAGIPLGLAEEANPVILHAPVGAVILREDWGITDQEILRAVHYHTVASPQMDALCVVVFLADLIEPNRHKWDGLERLRGLCYEDLDRAMVGALNGNFRYLRRNNQFIHPEAYKAYTYFQNCVHKQESPGISGILQEGV